MTLLTFCDLFLLLRGDAFPAAAVAAHLQNLEILFASNMGMTELPKLFDCPKLRMLGGTGGTLRELWTAGGP